MRRAQTPQELAEAIALAVQQRHKVTRIAVPVELAHATIGPRPTIALVNCSMGFDWDNGTLFLHPEQPLSPLSPDELAEIKQCRADGQSWAVHKAHERWQIERDALVDTIHRMRQALMLSGMSTAELDLLTGELPNKRPKRRTAPVVRTNDNDE